MKDVMLSSTILAVASGSEPEGCRFEPYLSSMMPDCSVGRGNQTLNLETA